MFNKDSELPFNIKDRYSPHCIVSQLVERKKTILDVGCNTGYIGQYLITHKNCICDGIDIDRGLLKKAKEAGYRHTFEIDLSQINFKIPECYDIILFIDILEHLPNPYLILKKIAEENLKENGKIIICLPNIARLEFRLKHLLGRFDYEESGIMHPDHLRFFTRDSALKMIQKANLRIKKILPTGLGARLNCLPTLTAFQFIFIGQKLKRK